MTDATVADASGLAALATSLAGEPVIGLDTEFMRERTYRAQLCLVQIAAVGGAWCIDPLAIADLGALQPPLTANGTIKVMHAARQDLEVLAPVFGVVTPVFDTQVAAALAGMPAQVGYGELVRRVLGVELGKAHTRTDWARRPLSEAQLVYAREDVIYLLELRERLVQQLVALGRQQWLDEELTAMCTAADLTVDPERAWERLRGLRELDPHRQRLARALAAWRERRAAERNRPRGWILDDAVLREIVHRAPRTRAALAEIPQMPPGVVEHSGTTLVELVHSAELPERLPPLPRRARPDPLVIERVQRLGALARDTATSLGVSPEILATRRELEQLAQSKDAAQPPDLGVLTGWRRGVLGERLLAALGEGR